MSSVDGILLTDNPKQEIAPAEVPIKKSNFSDKETLRWDSNFCKKIIEAIVLTPPPSRDKMYFFFNFKV